jgi:putative methyltransferase (TIGR04325 family)
MKTIKSAIKHKLLGAFELLPFGRDLYLSITRNRHAISYRGVFDSLEQANSAISSKKASSYDIVNADKAAHHEAEKQKLDDWFHDIDYPLLYWLSKLTKPNYHVLELGGSIGHFFYSIQNYSPCPAGVKWTIAELPGAVELGDKIAKERKEYRLSFIESKNIELNEPVEIFFSAGTLQYMDEPLPKILAGLAELPVHVLIHNLPAHANRQFWTLQNLGICEVPYHIFSKPELINSMGELGYDPIAQWVNPREIEIPFHREQIIEGYLGFYFRKKEYV